MKKIVLSGIMVMLVLTGNPVVKAEGQLFVDSVVPLEEQPVAQSNALIWYDDFDGEVRHYGEASGPLCETESFGGTGKSLLQHYAKGQLGEGNRKVFFGDSPMRNAARRGEKFDEIYWRIYIKHQTGWTGGGSDKLSRATTLVGSNWSQGMIAHVWSTGETLTLDPATGIKNNVMQTMRYNDFANLQWLGNKPTATTPIFSTENAGHWVCVEARAKLNTPGQKDGMFQLWIDGKLEAERIALDWRGTWDEKGINAVFLEAYWNNGSPVDQSRYIDLFVISTEPIGPVIVPQNPTLLRSPACDMKTKWFAEVGTESGETVWTSKPFDASIFRATVDSENGAFRGTLEGQNRLSPNTAYYFRLRNESDTTWSPYHQKIVTTTEK